MTAWSKDDKQRLAGTGGRVIGHTRNCENRRQQHRENRSAYVGTIGALNIPCKNTTSKFFFNLTIIH